MSSAVAELYCHSSPGRNRTQSGNQRSPTPLRGVRCRRLLAARLLTPNCCLLINSPREGAEYLRFPVHKVPVCTPRAEVHHHAIQAGYAAAAPEANRHIIGLACRIWTRGGDGQASGQKANWHKRHFINATGVSLEMISEGRGKNVFRFLVPGFTFTVH